MAAVEIRSGLVHGARPARLVIPRVAHVQRDGFRNEALLHEVEHQLIHHLAQHVARFLERVVARQHLAVAQGMPAGLVGVDVGDGARLDAVGVVDQVLRVHAELAVQRGLAHLAYAAQVVHRVLRQAPRDARADVPDIGDGPVGLDSALELGLVEKADAVPGVLRRDVERHFRQEQVRPDPCRGAHARLGQHRLHEHDGELPGARPVQRQVRRRIDEAFVDGIGMDVLGRHEAQVDGVDVGRRLHVALHARLRHDVVHALGDLEHAATAGQAERLHGRRDGQADGLLRAVGIGHDEVRRQRVQPAVDAFDAGVEALQIYAHVRALHRADPSPVQLAHLFV